MKNCSQRFKHLVVKGGIFLFFLSFTSQAAIAENDSAFKLGYGKMQGFTKYTIGGYVKYLDEGIVRTGYTNDPLSELIFSLQIDLVIAGFEHTFRNGFQLKGSYAQNLTYKTEKMEDRDWGIDGDAEDTLSIYSESDSEIKATQFEIGLYTKGWKILTFGRLKLGAIYKYQYFNYNISNTFQYSPSGLPGYDADISGKTLEYEIEYDLYFGESTLDFTFRNWKLLFGLQYAFYAHSRDRDNHILRSKISETEAEGHALELNAAFEYLFSQNSSLELIYSSKTIALSGTQVQKTDGVWTADIACDIESEQNLYALMYKYRF